MKALFPIIVKWQKGISGKLQCKSINKWKAGVRAIIIIIINNDKIDETEIWWKWIMVMMTIQIGKLIGIIINDSK